MVIVITSGKSGCCESGGRPRITRFRKRCSDCVLGILLKRSAIIAPPVLVDDGKRVRFLVVYSRAVKTLLREKREQVVSVRVLDIRRVLLTSRQRLTLKLVASGASTSKVAVELNVTRQAARKLFNRLMQKLAVVMT
jgi:DNA-binding CsgD family transcriptional regulator